MKHHLKASYYLRYSDDFVLVHEDPAQLLAWRAAIEEFLDRRLRLRLTDPFATPRPIQNGVDFLGYIVRPDYLLVRRRVVNRLKARLAGYEARLVRRRPGWMVFTHDAARLAALRASWASSLSHLNMAQTYRLRQALLRRWWWLGHFFTLDDGLLTPREPRATQYPRLKAQYDAVTRGYPGALVACQVGCFVELYDATAEQAMRRLGLTPVRPRRGFQRQLRRAPTSVGEDPIHAAYSQAVPMCDTRDRPGPWRGERQARCRVLAAGRGRRFATNRHES